jgi:hypothetical protein
MDWTLCRGGDPRHGFPVVALPMFYRGATEVLIGPRPACNSTVSLFDKNVAECNLFAACVVPGASRGRYSVEHHLDLCDISDEIQRDGWVCYAAASTVAQDDRSSGQG